jgi:DUF4097 and DUF4098 domain-containing protein YvlB
MRLENSTAEIPYRLTKPQKSFCKTIDIVVKMWYNTQMGVKIGSKKTFWVAVLIWAAAYVLMVLSLLFAVALVSAGVTAIFIGIGLSSGLIEQIAYIATDVAPGAMFFLGIGCVTFAAVVFVLLLLFLEHKGRQKIFNMKFVNACVSLGAVTLTATVIGLVLQITAVKNGTASTVFSEQKYTPPKNYVKINVTSTPVTIRNYDGKEILVKYLGETPLSVTESDDSVTVTQDDSFALSLFTLKQFRYELQIWLPETDFRALEVASASGNITADAKRFRALKITAKSGNITAENIRAIGNGGNSAVELKSKQGEINAEFSDLPKISELTEVVSVSGNVKIRIPEQAGIFMKYVSAKGRFTSDFFKEKYISVKPPPTGIYLAKDSAYPERQQSDFSIVTETGNLILRKV